MDLPQCERWIFTPIQRNRLNYSSVHWNLHIPGSLRRCPYYGIVVGLAWPDDPERHADGSVATGRVSRAIEFKSDAIDKKRYPAAPGRGLCEGIRTSSTKKPPLLWRPTMRLRISMDPYPRSIRFEEKCAGCNGPHWTVVPAWWWWWWWYFWIAHGKTQISAPTGSKHFLSWICF
jgi:hypothetical protein